MEPRSSNAPAMTLFFTVFALVAFAANSVLCRMALGAESIDASSFTVVRLFSGAVVLWLLLKAKAPKEKLKDKGSWMAALMLFTYAVAFSFAYISLDTGTGALVLFGSVQITIILTNLFRGHRLRAMEWVGVVVTFAGFVYLVLPNVTTPTFLGFVLMTAAGISWGFYTLIGHASKSPLADTASNFIRTFPAVIVLAIIALFQIELSMEGVLLAALSGSVASGIGYAIWYRALGGLTAIEAAVVQLSVPVVAAVGGIVFVSETLTLRFGISAILILGGILVVALGRYFSNP